MNWHKAKTILILFLIAVNLSLLTYTVYDGYTQRSAETQVMQNAIDILSNNGITVDKKIIDAVGNKDSVKEVYAYNIISDYSSFAKLVIGNEAQLKEKNTYLSPSGEIIFSGDRFYSKPNNNSCLMAFDTHSKNIIDTASEIFSELGITVNRKDIAVSESSGLQTVKISKKINKLPVFGAEISITFSELGITQAQGAWYEPEAREKTSKISLKGISGCLIDYMNERTGKKPCTITKITLGYATLDEDTYHASLMLTPVFAIENDLGEIIYIDARENI